MSQVREWLFGRSGKPRLVVGGKLDRELRGNRDVVLQLLELERAGITGLCRSNDTHVIGLALASGARTLCTNDRDLIADFRNSAIISKPRGGVYTKPIHRHLLRHTSSCGAG